MTPPSTTESLQSFQVKAFARHALFDLRLPILGTVLVLALNAWLMYGKVPRGAVVAWLAASALIVCLRECFVRHMQRRVNQGEAHLAALRGLALLSLPLGAISGSFAWLYFDPGQPLSVLYLGIYMAVILVGAAVPSSVYLPLFYLLLLGSHLPYLLRLLLGGADYLGVAAINALFLLVVTGYAQAVNQMHKEGVRLRYQNQALVSDLELRTAQAEEALRAKSLFLAGVSHDLKQPLRTIGLLTGYLRHSAMQGDLPAARVTQTTGKLDAATGAIHHLISRLLELSRLESGAPLPQLQTLHLHEAFERLRHALAGDAQAKGVQLCIRLGRQSWVLADRSMLDSILVNLVSNAILHAAASRVHVGTRLCRRGPGSPSLNIEVRDNGCGISPHRHPGLFEAYRSFDDRSASDHHGLGLAIARAQAHSLGCGIELKSAPGKGSRFTLTGLRLQEPAPA